MLLLSSCSYYSSRTASETDDQVDKLFVYDDGTMVFKNRIYDEGDVVIYEDGFGGEKAAVKMHVPLHPDFYRDSIIVERKSNTTDEK